MLVSVSIGAFDLWTGKTWNDYQTETWFDLAERTWYGACDPDTHIRLGSASIEHTIDGRSTAAFDYIDYNATHHFDKGQEVLIRDIDLNILFGGLIEEVTEELIGSASDPLVHTIQAARDRSKLGWIADEIETVFPKAVSIAPFTVQRKEIVKTLDTDGNEIETEQIKSEIVIEDCKHLDSDQIYAAMYGAVQKLITIVEDLQKEVEKLQKEVEKLKNKATSSA